MPIHLPPIRRRDFLMGGLAAGAGLLLPRGLRAQTPSVDPNCFALLADPHIGTHHDEVRHKMKSAETFDAACRGILALPCRPNAAFVAGDCAMRDGRASDYVYFGEMVKPLREAGLSLHLALGNHDNRENFWAAFPDAASNAPKDVPNKHISVVETQHANWFLLDSLDKTLSTPGLLGTTQLSWLATALDQRPNKPAIVMAHHHLNVLGTLKSLIDSRSLLDVLLPRKQVKAYVYGHTHWWGVGQPLGIHMVNVPTTAWPSEPSQPRGFVTAQVRSDGATLTLHSLDPKHPKHGEKFDLKWRT